MYRKNPELVSGAGDWPSLIAAVEGGADSVYFGIKGINMRDGAVNFDILEIKKVVGFLHSNNRKGFLALNVVVMNDELVKVRKILQEAKRAGVDAVILWDMAVFSIAKELGLRIHLSTQASVSNWQALSFFIKQGVARVVLARECTLSDIRKIIRLTEEENFSCEVETFIHGAMCVSISGRCFLSSYSHGKSANRGQCLQPCRRQFRISDCEGELDYVVGEDYIMSPKDLCTIDFVDDLIESGIDAFKIEGRMRSAEYIKITTSAYRKAIDSFFEGSLDNELKDALKKELFAVYNRGFSSGFYFGYPEGAISRGLEHSHRKVFLGEVMKFYRKISVAQICIQNHVLNKGDKILFIGKRTPARMAVAEQLQSNHVFITRAGRKECVGVKVPFEVRPRDKVFLFVLSRV